MGLQTIAFVLAYAFPALLIGPITEKDFTVFTKWMLAVIAASLGGALLFLVPYSGAYLQFIHIIRISYLVYALIAVAATGYLSSVASTRARDLATVRSVSDETEGPDDSRPR